MKTNFDQTVHKTREGWNESFCRMSKNNDDKLLDAETISTSNWDKKEWELDNSKEFSIDKTCVELVEIIVGCNQQKTLIEKTQIL